MINIITFDETTKRFAEYTESEWGEEIEWWRTQNESEHDEFDPDEIVST